MVPWGATSSFLMQRSDKARSAFYKNSSGHRIKKRLERSKGEGGELWEAVERRHGRVKLTYSRDV